MQIILLPQVRLIVFADVVIDQRDGHDEGNGAFAIEADNLQELLFFVRGKLFLEVTQYVDHDVGVLLGRGFETKGLHKQPLVFLVEILQGELLGAGHQHSHYAVMFNAMGEDQHLVFGMKVHQAPSALLFLKALPPPLKGEDPLDEILAELQIMKPTVLLNREKGEMLHKRPGEHPHPLFHGDSLFAIDLNTSHAAAGRPALEYEAAQVLLLQLPDPLARPPVHAIRIVYFRA